VKKTLAILNLLSVISVVAVNYISNAIRLNDTTIAEVSRQYDNLFTPASYAFAIWGLIFVSILAYSIFQIKRVCSNSKSTSFIEKTGYWFATANILNCIWVIVFVYDYVLLSVLIMLGILFSLVQIIIRNGIGLSRQSFVMLAFNWWPICLYAGWISVATVANISTYLTKVGWNGESLSEIQWTIIMISITVALNLFMVFKRNMREFGVVGIWALIALFVRHDDSINQIAYASIIGALLIFITISWNGYKNRKNNTIYILVKNIIENKN